MGAYRTFRSSNGNSCFVTIQSDGVVWAIWEDTCKTVEWREFRLWIDANIPTWKRLHTKVKESGGIGEIP